MASKAFDDLYWWQKKEVDANAFVPKKGLFWEPRCGKTLTGYYSMLANIKPGDEPKILITCPVGVGSMWAEEMAELGLPVHRLYSAGYGTIVARGDILRTIKPPFVVIINPHTLKYFAELLVKLKFDYYIADESHTFANPNAKGSRAYRKLAGSIPWVRAMTGTPTSKGLQKFWNQLAPFNYDRWGKTYKQFRDKHLIMHHIFPNTVKDYQNKPLLEAMIAVSASMLKREDVFGPDEWNMTKNVLTLPPKAASMYKVLEKDYLIESSELTMTATHALVHLLRQQQFAAGFAVDDSGETVDIHTAKLDAVETDLAAIIEADKKAIIFHRYKWETQKYTELATKMCPTFTISGDVHIKDRERFIQEFRDHKGSMVGVVQIQSGGVGISFAEADYVLRTSRSPYFIDDAQALVRAFKPGHPRTVIDYEIQGTVDQFFNKILDQGLDVHNAAMSLNAQQMLQNLKRE